MGTKIRVKEEITEGLETVKPGDIVKSINHGGIVLVTEAFAGTFAGIVLDKGNYEDWDNNDYVTNFNTGSFKPFTGTITLECE